MDQLLAHWDKDAVLDRRLSGGARNDVWAILLGGQQCVARWSTRPRAAMEWELALLDHLFACGFRVPTPIESRDGHRIVGGLTVFSWIGGNEPKTTGDWQRVAGTLRDLHATTRDWPQRPSFRSSVDLITLDRGGDVDLGNMPNEVAELCRAAWPPLERFASSVIHGDPNRDNVRMTPSGVGLLDFDEARVDISLLDFSDLPIPLGSFVPEEVTDKLKLAADAWEVANAWHTEPAYAQKRLQRMRARLDRQSP